jgi:hypothetical protein
MWAAVGVFRLLMAGRFGLSVDEAHYAMYARNPAWGYFDHPPMVAFLGIITTLFEENAFFYRTGPVICWLGAVLVIRSLLLRVYGSTRTVFWVLALLLAMPVQNLMGIALLPDAPLNLFWCLGLLFAWRALEENRIIDWVLLGVSFGFALLSKYHAVLLPMCLAGYILFSPQRRKLVLSPMPYLAGVVGLLVFLPNVIWNARRDWISYVYQLRHGGGDSEFELDKVAEVLGGQLGAVSPVLFVLMVVAWAGIIKRYRLSEADKFMLWTSLPVFIFFCGAGMVGDMLPHWPSIGLWTGAVCLFRFMDERGAERSPRRRLRRRWLIGGEITGLVIVVFMYAAVSFPLISIAYKNVRSVSIKLSRSYDWIQPLGPFRSKYDPTNDMYGWEEAAARVEEIRDDMPRTKRTFVFAHRFYTASQLGVHLERSTVITSLSGRRNQYRLWFRPADREGWDALFVDHDRYLQGAEKYAPLFERVDKDPVEIRISRDGQQSHLFRVYRCYGYKGRYPE